MAQGEWKKELRKEWIVATRGVKKIQVLDGRLGMRRRTILSQLLAYFIVILQGICLHSIAL